MADKVTDWFHISVMPARKGWYDYQGRLWDDSRMYWNGYQWGYFHGRNWVHMAGMITDQWRGLSRKPKQTRERR